jgi:hypothetical protein
MTVVTLHGAPAHVPGEPHQNVVAAARRVLASAEAGDVVALAVVYVSGGGYPVEIVSIPENRPASEFFALHSGAVLLAAQLGNDLQCTSKDV